MYDSVVHYRSENGSVYAIPRNKSNSSIKNNLQDDTLQAETPDGMGPIAMTTLSSTDSLAAPYSDPVHMGVVAISNHSINTADRVHSISVSRSVFQSHPNLQASSPSAGPYMDPVPAIRRATLPTRPTNFHPFQLRQLSSSTARSIPSMDMSPLEITNSPGGMSVTAKQGVTPYAFSSVANLNTVREECTDCPAMYMEPTSTAHDVGKPLAAFPYCEPSRLMLDRIPAETPPGLPYTEPNHDRTEVALPYQDPVSTVNVNRHAARHQSMEQLPNPYLEPSPTSGLGHKQGIQEDQNLVMDLFSGHSSPKVPH